MTKSFHTLLATLLLLLGMSVHAGEIPSWALNPPADDARWLWGVGEGQNIGLAKRNALKDIAAKLQVTISGQIENEINVTNGVVNKKARSKVAEVVQKTVFRNYLVEKTDHSGGNYLLLLKVDRKAFTAETKATLGNLDNSLQQALSRLDNNTPLNQYIILQRLQPDLDKAADTAQILIGAEPGGEGLNYLRKYSKLQNQISHAAEDLVFRIQASPADQDIAAIINTYLNEAKIRTSKTAGNVLSISSNSRADRIGADNYVRLNIVLSIQDAQGQSLASRNYTVTGNSVYDSNGARQSALQTFLQALREVGFEKGMGFVN